MSQHDYDISTADANTGITFRAAVNASLQALAGNNSGASEPTTPYAYMFWADTTTGLLKQRNAANNAWITLGKMSTGFGVPAGTPLSWLTETVPTGYLERNGASLDRTTYADLFAVIGTTYGAADASHFNLPDHRGSFPRYWDHAKAKDPNGATRTAVTATGATMTAGDHVGTEQTDAFKAHDHGGVCTGGGAALAGGSGLGLAGQPVGGNETRPVNHYEMPIIKY